MSAEFKVSEIIDKIFAGFEKITPALIFCCLATGLILFLPKAVLEKLGLSNMSSTWRTVVGIVFLLLFSAIIVLLLSYPFNCIIKALQRKRLNKKLEKKWLYLNDEQKAIICTLLSEPEKTGYLCSTSGNTHYLVSNAFIFQPEQLFEPYHFELGAQKLIYCLQPWVLDLYSKKPKLFDMSTVNSNLIAPNNDVLF